MPEIQPNKLSDLTAQAADLFKQGKKVVAKEAKEFPTTGAVAKDVKNAAKAGEKANLAPLTKDGLELGGYESPSPNVKIKEKTPIPESLLKYLKTDEPVGAVAQDINTSILPKHNIIDRPPLILPGEPGAGKTRVEQIIPIKEPIENLVVQDASNMITPAADKANLLKAVAEAEAKYKPKRTTVIGDESFPPPPPEVNNFL